MDDLDRGLTRQMKRVLSIDFQNPENNNNNRAANGRNHNYGYDDDDDDDDDLLNYDYHTNQSSKRPATDTRNVLTDQNGGGGGANATNDIVVIENEHRINDNALATDPLLRQNFHSLREMFPEVEDNYLLRVLRRYGVNIPESLTMAIDELIANPPRTAKLKSVDVVEIRTPEPTAAAALNNQNMPQVTNPATAASAGLDQQQQQHANANGQVTARERAGEGGVVIDQKLIDDDSKFLSSIFSDMRPDVILAVARRFQRENVSEKINRERILKGCD
jgi:hypothetical protein